VPNLIEIHSGVLDTKDAGGRTDRSSLPIMCSLDARRTKDV